MSEDKDESDREWWQEAIQQMRLWTLRVYLVIFVLYLIGYVLTETRFVDKTGRQASSFMLSPLLHPLADGWSTSTEESPLPVR